MGRNPFNQELDDVYRGETAHVVKGNDEYIGTFKIANFSDGSIILYNATKYTGPASETRNDGTDVGTTMIRDPDVVCQPTTNCEKSSEHLEVAPGNIAPHEYSQRSFDTTSFHEYVRDVRKNQNIGNTPLVVEHPDESADEDYMVVSGHKRREAAERAGLSTIQVECSYRMDAWDVAARFVDEHVPLTQGEHDSRDHALEHDKYTSWYSDEKIERVVAALRADFPDKDLETLPQLRPFLDESTDESTPEFEISSTHIRINSPGTPLTSPTFRYRF